MSAAISKKRRLNPVSLSAPKQLDARSTIININMLPKTNFIPSENEINYNFENLLTEQGNLVLDYNELFTVEHQKEQLMLELEQKKLKEANKSNKSDDLTNTNDKSNDLEIVEDDDEDDDEDEAEEDDDEDDDDEEDVDLEDDEKLPKENSKGQEETLPKKRVSALKGKALVGKYDLEDPFIDDSEEVIVETGRKVKNEGVDFCVFFGEFQPKDLQR
ncbi:uncharacterized protein HGUI_00677 [Hanseniaspora guilliermondii]|uniref:Hpc2-related domain-containing protein n=1 Tax=Hanseniaspora guilliermondii TaxID=56406 RepID=A0A1L0CI76_9ASCO|nr:uncharacterized protein HGUI_00677 [Hanseniaspora guilliermondii]